MNPDPPNDPWNAPAQPVRPIAPMRAESPPAAPQTEPVATPPITPFTKVRLAIAWACIIICTLVLIFLQSSNMEKMQEHYADDPRPGFAALYLARYATGVEQIMSGQAGQMMPQFDATIATTSFPIQNKTRSVILAGEIAPATLDNRLNDLQLLQQSQADVGIADEDAKLILAIYESGHTPTPNERDGLIQRHGWFGEIAASYNLPKNNSDYSSPRRSALIVALGLFALILTIIVAGLTGFVLAILAIVFLSTGKIRGNLASGPTTHRSAYLEVVALFLVGFILLQLGLSIVEVATGLYTMPIFLVLSALPLLWPVLLRVPWKQYKREMGYHTGKGLFREIGAGFVGYLAGLPIIAVGMAMIFVFSLFTEATADHPMQYELMDGGPLGPWIMLAAAVIWAPLVEESVFRSAFHRHLRQHRGFIGFAFASLVSGFVFAAIHPQGWIAIPTLMCIAFVLSYLREWRSSIIPSMVAHALHNGTISLMMGIVLFA